MPCLHELPVETPAFVFDQSRLLAMVRLLGRAREISGCRVLYSVKALPLVGVLELLSSWVDGFSVSSLFEARLAQRFGLPLHITTPGLKAAEIAEIGTLCAYLAFNSLEQFERLHGVVGEKTSQGLRVNPGLSWLDDPRYDPCRRSSKLGIPLDDLARAWLSDELPLRAIKGLHFHSAYSLRSFTPLQETMALIESALPDSLLPRLEWINLGGGYLFENLEDLSALMQVVSDLRARLGVEVYFEPGKALVGRAGYLISSVIDRFVRDGKTVLVLDASVNHNPEIFEYQRRPEPVWSVNGEGETAVLAGCTCLAGDLFGEYRFEKMPHIGDRMAFANMGAYSLVKASRFNGYNLPCIYLWYRPDNIEKVKQYRFEHYRDQWVSD